jgi:hypothetical protein
LPRQIAEGPFTASIPNRRRTRLLPRRAGRNGPARIVPGGPHFSRAAESFAMIAPDSPSLFEALPDS